MIIKLAMKNIKNSFQSSRKIYILMMISQLTAVISIFFAYGIYTSYSAKMQELDIDSYIIGADFSRTEVCELGSLRECLPEILDKMENKMDYVFVSTRYQEQHLVMYNEYYDGKFHLSETIATKENPVTGRMLTDGDVVNANKVVYKIGVAKAGQAVDFGGTKFEVIGDEGDERLDAWWIPITSCPEDAKVFAMSVIFNELPTQEDYLALEKGLKKEFGNRVTMDEFEVRDEEELISIRSIIMISLAVGMISALNTCLLYGYIISRRRKQMAVYGIVGASKTLRLAIQQMEIMLVSLAMELVGFLLFRFALQDLLVSVYETGVRLYGAKSYVIMLTAYTLCIFLITYLMLKIMNREKLTDMMRRTRND